MTTAVFVCAGRNPAYRGYASNHGEEHAPIMHWSERCPLCEALGEVEMLEHNLHRLNGGQVIPLLIDLPLLPNSGNIVEIERRAILAALERCQGNKLEAARQLGIGKTTIYRKLREYRQTGAYTFTKESAERSDERRSASETSPRPRSASSASS